MFCFRFHFLCLFTVSFLYLASILYGGVGLAVWVEELGLSTFCPFDHKSCRHPSGSVLPPSPLPKRGFIPFVVLDGICETGELDQETLKPTGRVIVCSRFVDLVSEVRRSGTS